MPASGNGSVEGGNLRRQLRPVLRAETTDRRRPALDRPRPGASLSSCNAPGFYPGIINGSLRLRKLPLMAESLLMQTYTITELAREFGITPRAIRFYEDQGLLSPAREGAGGRNRVYSTRERTRLKLTLRGRRLGLALSEIKGLVDMYESSSDSAAQMQCFLAVLGRHRAMLEQQREDIDVMLAEISQHEKVCQQVLDNSMQPDAGVAQPADHAGSAAPASMPARSDQRAA